MAIDLHQCMKIGIHAVKEAATIIKKLQQKSKKNIGYKSNNSPVTDADKLADKKIRAILNNQFPLHGIISEEFPPLRGRSNYAWIGDAIDGTWSYINGETTVATSLALGVKRRTMWNVLLSIIYNPFTNELYSCGEGIRPTKNGKILSPHLSTQTEKSIVNFHIARDSHQDIVKLYQLWRGKKISKLISTGGSISYNLAKVAEGVQSTYILQPKQPLEHWDYCAGAYLVKSIGGSVTDHQGKELASKKKPPMLIASKNKEQQQQIMSLLKYVKFGD